jgi:hypothetical protein
MTPTRTHMLLQIPKREIACKKSERRVLWTLLWEKVTCVACLKLKEKLHVQARF